MHPLILKGHTRPLTQVKYNREGDLLFSVSKDNVPTVWFSENGERLGTYEGHRGTVWSLDVTRDSKYLVTAGADMTVKIWSVELGTLLHNFNHSGTVKLFCCCRCCSGIDCSGWPPKAASTATPPEAAPGARIESAHANE
jgi:WD40 repeat protein